MRGAISLALSTAVIAAGGALLVLGTPALAGIEQGNAEKGKEIYTIFCVTCHGELGDGQGLVGKTLDPPPRDFTKGEWKFGGTDQDIFDVISNGGAAKGGSPLMAPWGQIIPEADRWSLVIYVKSLKAKE